MARNASVLTAYMCSGYDMGFSGYHSLHLAIPFSGVFTVGLDEFLHVEMLIGVVPIYPGIGVEVFSHGICILS